MTSPDLRPIPLVEFCWVCGGKGQVPRGFYTMETLLPENEGLTEMCRSCQWAREKIVEEKE